jgi:hypothetical protein
MLRKSHLVRRVSLLGALAVLVSAAASMAFVSVAAAAAPTARISGVTWIGSPSSLTLTINGSGFGKRAPSGGVAPSSLANCGGTGSGLDYNNQVWVIDDTSNFQAGQLQGKSGGLPVGNCVGLNITSWSPSQIVLTFGSAYGTSPYVFNNGDNFVVETKGWYWGGTITILPGYARDAVTRRHRHILLGR